jgi:ubiquinol-cytochrome c reductase cytochrome c subunit
MSAAWIRSTPVLLALCCAAGAHAGAAQSGAALLYQTRCSSCHGSRGEGSQTAPSLVGTPAVYVHFMLDTGRMPADARGVNEVHKEPIFTERQIDELTAYVEHFTRHPNLTMPVLGPGNVVRGRTLFDENCQQCHSAAGAGASIGGDDVAPSLMHATVFQVAEAIRSGPGMMPRFGPNVFSAAQVSDVARYVNYIQEEQQAPAEDAGGIGLAHVGPVAEGLIAWLFGIGTLVVFLRCIGEK